MGANGPVGEDHHVVGVRGGVQVVGDHDHGLPELTDRGPQVPEDLPGGLAVQVARRLVGEDQRRLGHQGAGDGHPLLLPAGQLRRPVIQPVGQAEDLGHRPEALPGGGVVGPAGQLERQPDVLLGAQHRQQVERLEHEAELLPAEHRELGVGQRLQRRSGDDHRARGGPIQTGQAVQQGRLARTGPAHDGREPAGGQLEVDRAQGMHLGVAPAVAAAEAAGRGGRSGAGALDQFGRVHGPSLRNRGLRCVGPGVGLGVRLRAPLKPGVRPGRRAVRTLARPGRSRRPARPGAPGPGSPSWPAAGRCGS